MTSKKYFHEGEALVQAAAGVDTEAFEAMVAGAMQPELNPNEVAFLGRRTFSVAASVDADGRPWVSPLFGAAGELFVAESPTRVSIRAQHIDGDPLLDNLHATGKLGVLYFDPSRRQRMKSIGRAVARPDGTISYEMDRAFGICNKYIFKRTHDPQPGRAQAVASPVASDRLSVEDQLQLGESDTVFLGSHHEVNGADPTHRGGPAGLVTVVDDATVSIPDYMGNGMFNTLGNLQIDDRVGLLSVDFVSGRTVQITGRGDVRASPPDDEMSARTVWITIDQVIVTHPDVGRWTDVEAFDLRPGLINPATPYLAVSS